MTTVAVVVDSRGGNTRKAADTLKQQGAAIIGSWHCPGKFLIMNRGRLLREDLDNAKTFARDMLT